MEPDSFRSAPAADAALNHAYAGVVEPFAIIVNSWYF